MYLPAVRIRITPTQGQFALWVGAAGVILLAMCVPAEKRANKTAKRAAILDQTSNYLNMPICGLMLGDRVGTMQVLAASDDYLHLAPPFGKWSFMLRDIIFVTAGAVCSIAGIAIIVAGFQRGSNLILTIKFGAIAIGVGVGLCYAAMRRKPYQIIAQQNPEPMIIAQSISLFTGTYSRTLREDDIGALLLEEGVLRVGEVVQDGEPIMRTQHAFGNISGVPLQEHGGPIDRCVYPLLWLSKRRSDRWTAMNAAVSLCEVAGFYQPIWFHVGPKSRTTREKEMRKRIHKGKKKHQSKPGYDDRGMPHNYFSPQLLDVVLPVE